MSKRGSRSKTFLKVFCLAVMITACNKEKQPAEYTDNRLYFKGTIFGQEKYFQDSINDYKADFTSTFDASTQLGGVSFGMTTLPVPKLGNESIYFGGGSLKINDAGSINNFFSVGKKPFRFNNQTNGFSVVYGLIQYLNPGFPMYSYTYWNTNGDQSGSVLEIIDKHELPQLLNSDYHRLRVMVRINCKLYDESGINKGDIKDGILAGVIVYR